MKAFRTIAASLMAVGVWLFVKYALHVSSRYLPGVSGLGQAISDIGSDWWIHIAATISRTIIGFILGVTLGVVTALLFFKLRLLQWMMPTVQAIRAVPAVTFVPFFLLWFGFSEIGRYLLVLLGLGLNVLVACADTLEKPSEADRILFRNFDAPLNTRVVRYWLPRVLEGLLPTLRFGVALALGVIVVSEMLGAQSGLGYLIQTSRQTFSLNVIFLCAVLLGLIATGLDGLLQVAWRSIVTWRR